MIVVFNNETKYNPVSIECCTSIREGVLTEVGEKSTFTFASVSEFC